MKIKVEAKLLVELNSVLKRGNPYMLYQEVNQENDNPVLHEMISGELNNNLPAVFFRRFQNDLTKVNNSDIVCDLARFIWLYSVIADLRVSNSQILKEIVMNKSAKDSSSIGYKKLMDYINVNFHESNFDEHQKIIVKYHKWIKAAQTMLKKTFVGYQDYQKVIPLYLEVPNAVKQLKLDVLGLLAAFDNHDSYEESLEKWLENEEGLQCDSLLSFHLYQHYWLNNTNSIIKINDKRRVIDILRRLWFYQYLMVVPHDIAFLKKEMSDKYYLERQYYFLDPSKTVLESFSLITLLDSTLINKQHEKEIQCFLKQYSNDLDKAHCKILEFFTSQGPAFMPLLEIYPRISLVKTPTIDSLLVENNMLKAEIEVYEHQVKKHQDELEHCVDNTIIDLVNALNDNRFTNPLDALYTLKKSGNEEAQAVAYNFFNALARLGVKIYGEQYVGKKVDIKTLKEIGYRLDINSNTKKLEDVYLVTSVGYKYKNDIILPVKVRKE